MIMIKYKTFLILFLIFGVISCSADDYQEDKYSKKIWSTDKFCAFTDLVEYNNVYYCCFRESDGHLPSSSSNYGKIRILSSIDGVNWISAALIEDSEYDLRDPKLEVTSDGRLMLLVGCSNQDLGYIDFKKTKVAFSTIDLSGLSDLKDLKLGQNGEYNKGWLWRSIWHDNVAYGIVYMRNSKPALLKSTDGVNYEQIVQYNLPTSCNEAAIVFRSNGNMIVAIRDNKSNGYIAESEFPYKHWDWKEIQTGTQCPTMINVDEYIFISKRDLSKRTVSLQFIKPNDGLNMHDLLDIFCSGDYAYPGLASNNKFIFMSYYVNGEIFLSQYPINKVYDNTRR